MQKKVSYVKILGMIFLVCSVGLMVTALFVGPSLNTVTGIIMFILSVCYLVNPPIVYTNEKIMMKNLWGMTTKTYWFSTDELSVYDDDIYARGRRIKLSRAILNQEEYLSLVDHIADKFKKKRSEKRTVEDITTISADAGEHRMRAIIVPMKKPV